MEIKKNEKINGYTVELEIAVGKEEFEAAVEEAYKKNKNKIRVPGFRPGRAPRGIIERTYGKSVFYEDAVNSSAPTAYEQAIEKLALEPVAQPEMEMTELSDEGYSFKAKVTVRPDVTLKDYQAIRVAKQPVEITDEDVQDEIERIAKRNARTENADRPAETGDTLRIDFEGFVDGVAFGGGKGEDFSIKIGSGTFIPGFEDQLIGHVPGDEFDVTVTFPEDYQAEDLAGKEAVFKTKVRDVTMEILPEIDDEFAKDVSEFDTLEELREDTRKNLLTAREHNADNVFSDEVLSKLADCLEGEIPEVMYDNAVENRIQDFHYRMEQQGISAADYLKFTGTTEDQLREQFREGAVQQVKVSLALSALAKEQGFEATAEEIDEAYAKIATENLTVEQIKTMLPEDSMKSDILTEKAMNYIKEIAAQPAEEKAEEKAEEAKDAE